MDEPAGKDARLTAEASGRPAPAQVIAAVDLGSNSFHMVVARRESGRVTIIDRVREMVILGAGLDAAQRIETATAERAIACLERFGERLRIVQAGSVRAVGTNTLRRARDDRAFIVRAERALGWPIEIITGIEEARLVYLGAAATEPAERGRRLVVDIGGGSTELAIGTGLNATRLESLGLGCVAMSAGHFAGGALTPGGFARARAAARLELEPVASDFRELGWRTAVGTSGTIRATADILRGAGYRDGIITPARLDEIAGRMAAAGHLDRLALPGLTAERKIVYPGGLAILQEVCASLGLSGMPASEGALREGLLHDLLTRMRDEVGGSIQEAASFSSSTS